MSFQLEHDADRQREIEILKYRLQKRIILLDKLVLALLLLGAGYLFNRSIEGYKSSLAQALEGYKADRQQFMAEIQAQRARELSDLNSQSQREIEGLKTVLNSQSAASTRRIQAYEALGKEYGSMEQFVTNLQAAVLLGRGATKQNMAYLTEDQRSQWRQRVAQFEENVGEQAVFVDDQSLKEYEDVDIPLLMIANYKDGIADLKYSEEIRKKLVRMRKNVRLRVQKLFSSERTSLTTLSHRY